MEWGENLDTLLDWAAQGMDVPCLSEQPTLDDTEFMYMVAFRQLGRGRRIGMAAGGIPIPDMVAYAQAFFFCDLQRFIRIMCAMDGEFLVICGEIMDKASA